MNVNGLLSNSARWTEKLVLFFVALLLVLAGYVAYAQFERNKGKYISVVENIAISTLYSGESEPILVANDLKSSAKADNKLALYPHGQYWLRLALINPLVGSALTVEQPLLRPSEAQYWRVVRKSSTSNTGQVVDLIPLEHKLSRSGVAVDLGNVNDKNVEIIARVRGTTVVRPKAMLWRTDDFVKSSVSFERGGGALIGAILALALFSTVIAGLNRDRTFWLFAGWLITSFRVAAVNGGWDAYWLGANIESWLVDDISRITLALHAPLTVELLRSIFAREFGPKAMKILVTLRNIFVALVAISPFMSAAVFLPTFWIAGSVGIALGLTVLVTSVSIRKSSVASLYLLSWAVSFFGILGEVASATGLLAVKIPILNAQVGAVASALLTAIALAERLRMEKTRRLAAQTQAVGALRQYRDNYNSLPIGIFALDEFGAFTGYNPAFAEMLGLPQFSSSGPRLTWSTLFGRESLDDLEISLRGTRVSDLEIFRPSSEGEGNWYLVRASHKAVGIEGSFQDVTARKLAEHRFKHLADHDPLTDLLNLRGLSGEINKSIDRVEDGSQSSLAFVDLDRFKLVNDLFGHFAGDQVLIQIAQRLRNRFGPPHVLGRMGGDEFVIVLNDCSPVAAKVQCEEVLREIIEHPYHVGDKAFAVTCSIGLVELQPGMSERDALAACDRACAEAKSHGGSQVIVYAADDASMVEQLDEIRLISLIRQKLPVERLFTVMQPIVSLTAPYSNLNYEVLLRMRDADGSVILPGRFVAAAERNGLMADIDRWVLNTVLEWLEQHPEHRDRVNFAAINLSGASLNDERFLQDAMAAIRRYPRSASRVCFEITESVALYDLKNTRRFVDRVRSFGSMVALDDFGAGYTSFNYLKELPADLVKIDGSFIRLLDTQPANYAITRAILDLSHQIGMSVVAEWVESVEVLEALMGLGIDYGQGFLLARPLSTETLVPARNSGSLVQDEAAITLLNDRRPPVFQRPNVLGKSEDIIPRER